MYVLYSVSLCCFVYCFCVNVYLQQPPGLNPTAVNKIYQYVKRSKLVGIGCNIISFQTMYVQLSELYHDKPRGQIRLEKLRTHHYAVLHVHLSSLFPAPHNPCSRYYTRVATDCIDPAIFPQHLVTICTISPVTPVGRTVGNCCSARVWLTLWRLTTHIWVVPHR